MTHFKTNKIQSDDFLQVQQFFVETLLQVYENFFYNVIPPLTIFPPTPVEQLISPNKVLTPKKANIMASLKSISSWLGTMN